MAAGDVRLLLLWDARSIIFFNGAEIFLKRLVLVDARSQLPECIYIYSRPHISYLFIRLSQQYFPNSRLTDTATTRLTQEYVGPECAHFIGTLLQKVKGGAFDFNFVRPDRKDLALARVDVDNLLITRV